MRASGRQNSPGIRGGRGRVRLIVNADDFGRSTSINEAVERAHGQGILTSASLMVGGEAFDDAVDRARRLPDLGVGLHLTLACGRAVTDPRRIPGLADRTGRFRGSPVTAGFRYWAQPGLRVQLREEIAAQFDRFRATGLGLDHVNGHLHFHVHPVVLDLLLENAPAWGLRRMRLPRDPLGLSLRTLGGRWGYRMTHALVFAGLCRRARPRFERAGIRHPDLAVGLLADGRVDEAYLLRVLPRLPAGTHEVFLHPSMDGAAQELAALLSPRVRGLARELEVEWVRYRDVWGDADPAGPGTVD